MAFSPLADFPMHEIAPESLPEFFAARWAGRLPTLWCEGDAAAMARPLAAVIGTRAPSARGLAAVRVWTRELVRGGALVLSGGALGIDLEAHRGALDADGATLVVPACGLRTYQPPAWLRAGARAGRATLLTNLPPDAPGSRSAPVLRNRVVAALADLALVVESPARSGTAYVARAMRRRGGPLFVVEYDAPPPPRTAAGNAALLRAGALALPEHPAPEAVARLVETLHRAHATRETQARQPDFFPQAFDTRPDSGPP